jgi:hypothetical protein
VHKQFLLQTWISYVAVFPEIFQVTDIRRFCWRLFMIHRLPAKECLKITPHIRTHQKYIRKICFSNKYDIANALKLFSKRFYAPCSILLIAATNVRGSFYGRCVMDSR